MLFLTLQPLMLSFLQLSPELTHVLIIFSSELKSSFKDLHLMLLELTLFLQKLSM